jgi:hypothetical protein
MPTASSEKTSMLKCPAILFDIDYLLLKSLHSHGSVGAIGHASIRGLCRTMATSSLVRDLPQSIGRTRSALFSRGRIRDGISYGLSTIRILRIQRDDFIITSIGNESLPMFRQVLSYLSLPVRNSRPFTPEWI